MIATCLLDMGNVVVLFSHEVMCRQIGALCGRSAEDVRRILFETGLQLEFERGRMTEREFHRRIEDAVGQSLDDEALRRAGSDIFRPNPPMPELLKTLKGQGIRLVLLSNTSPAHFTWVQQHFEVLDVFDEYVLSYEVGEIKPHPAMYEAALAAIQCPPEKCFYTDDIPDNVEAAHRFGLQADVYRDVSSFKRQLVAGGVGLPE